LQSTNNITGVDLGTMNTVVAVARNRGVDVVSLCFVPLISSVPFYPCLFCGTITVNMPVVVAARPP